MEKKYNIAIAGTGYVGLSLSTLLSQHNYVTAVDIISEKVDKINNRISPVQDEYIDKYFSEFVSGQRDLDLTAVWNNGEDGSENSYYSNKGSYGKYCNTDDHGNWENSGVAKYNDDKSLSRLDNYSPSSDDDGKHHHEWLKQNPDGSYEYGHGEDDNH